LPEQGGRVAQELRDAGVIALRLQADDLLDDLDQGFVLAASQSSQAANKGQKLGRLLFRNLRYRRYREIVRHQNPPLHGAYRRGEYG
jgi:hypothetical protein